MKVLFRCWILAVVLVSMPFLPGCGSSLSSGTPGEGETVSWKLPELAQIANPDDAEKAIYAGVKAYEFALGKINRDHAAGKISDDRHDELMVHAERYRVAALAAWNWIQIWRSDGERDGFVGAYGDMQVEIARLTAGVRP